MSISEKEYYSQRTQQIKRRKRIVTIVGGVGFVGSLIFSSVTSILSSLQKPSQPPVTESIDTQLQKQAQGYELVLQREPNNALALENLTKIRLQLGDNQGAVELIERLLALYPERESYRTVLAAVKQKIAEEK